jgi:hypothetical protein
MNVYIITYKNTTSDIIIKKKMLKKCGKKYICDVTMNISRLFFICFKKKYMNNIRSTLLYYYKKREK